MGAEVVNQVEVVQVVIVHVQRMCRGGAEQEVQRGAEVVQRCNSAYLQSCRCRGAEMEVLSMCRGSALVIL